MSYKYDDEVKNTYMNVQSKPEIIKAALGDQTKDPEIPAALPELKKKVSNKKSKKYSVAQILEIYQTLGRFKSPIS